MAQIIRANETSILVTLLFVLVPATSDFSYAVHQEGRIGIIGDSLAAGTHSSQMCGNDDIVDCLAKKLGEQSRDWSYASGVKSWSIARRLGFPPERVIDASDNGEAWEDAFDQAKLLLGHPDVAKVFIGLGANDICNRRGHDYTGDLETIAKHIDATLSFLTDHLPAQGQIYWSAAPDVVTFRDLMVDRSHDYLFDNCQATWDLNEDDLHDTAIDEACRHYFGQVACGSQSVFDQVKDWLVDLFIERWFAIQGVEEGPCGNVLHSRSTAQDRAAAKAFTIELNRLMAEKAEAYHRRNGIDVFFSDGIYRAASSIRPYHLSRLDCFHPNRAGQMKLANKVWQGFARGSAFATVEFVDEFDTQDYCAQEFTTWGTCWTEIGEACGPSLCDVQIRNGALQIRDQDKGIWREVNLEGVEEAWIAFTFRREDLDQRREFVSFDVSPDGGQTWFALDRFRGEADDFGVQRGNYYDLSAYANPHTRIRFLGASSLANDDKVLFDNVKIFAWHPQMRKVDAWLPVIIDLIIEDL